MINATKIFLNLSARARRKRAQIFRSRFQIDSTTRILDLGSEDGSNIFNVLRETNFSAENVFIADINREAIEKGNAQFGFQPVLIDESGKLDFEDAYFDIVYCSSVIEHTTIPKSEVWKIKSGKIFRARSWERQRIFAEEIRRLGKQYFVQTPCKSFPIESHTWLPFFGFLPRRILVPALSLSNRIWVKQAEPDFNLLGKTEMQNLFPESEIVCEKEFGFTKSLMATKSKN